MPTPNNRYESLAEAAARVGVSTRTLRRRIAEGVLPAVRCGPQLIRVRPADVDASLRPVVTGSAELGR